MAQRPPSRNAKVPFERGSCSPTFIAEQSEKWFPEVPGSTKDSFKKHHHPPWIHFLLKQRYTYCVCMAWFPTQALVPWLYLSSLFVFGKTHTTQESNDTTIPRIVIIIIIILAPSWVVVQFLPFPFSFSRRSFSPRWMICFFGSRQALKTWSKWPSSPGWSKRTCTFSSVLLGIQSKTRPSLGWWRWWLVVPSVAGWKDSEWESEPLVAFGSLPDRN